MDDFDEVMKAVSDDGISAARPVIKILTKMWQNARDDLKEATARANRLRVVSIISAVLAVLCLTYCVYLGTVVHRQQGEIGTLRGEVDALHRILKEGVVVREPRLERSWTCTNADQDVIIQLSLRCENTKNS